MSPLDLRDVLAVPAPVSAPLLLGATLTGRGVTLRITEVEAYHGPTDPGSHGHRGPTARNASPFGAPGTLYAYRSYGIHTCVNVVSGAEGLSSGALIRAGEVVDGLEVARSRRGPSVRDTHLARGPGNVGVALGAVLAEDDGTSVLDGSGPYVLTLAPGLGPRRRFPTDAPAAGGPCRWGEARLASAPPAPPATRPLPETRSGRQDSEELARGVSATPSLGSPGALVAEVAAGLLAEPLPDGRPRVSVGPRTGIRGVAGGAAFPWRWWCTDDPTVSAYRRHPQALD